MNRRKVGGRYEEIAADYLAENGCVVLESNYRSRYGEIDLIVRDGGYLAFVEVKYRSDLRMGDPLEAVDFRKQNRIRGAARYYLNCRGYGENIPCRFDVVGILGGDITWVRDAF